MGLTKQELQEKVTEKGIFIPENLKPSNEVLTKLLGEHYMVENPEKVTWATKYIQSLKTPMLIDHYKDNIQYFAKEDDPMTSENWISELKSDGFRCIVGGARVLLPDGSYKTIKEIVDNRLEIEVMSYDSNTKTLVPKKVTGWFNNGRKNTDEWVHLKYKDTVSSKLKVTKDHEIYTSNRGWVQAQELVGEDSLVATYRGLNPTQEQIVYGSFLGDGCISTEKRSSAKGGSHRLVLTQGYKQLDYLNLKNQTLGEFSRDTISYKTGYGSLAYKAVSKPIVDLIGLVQENYSIIEGERFRRKRITTNLLNKLDWLGLAVWYLDDGSRAASKEDNIKNTNYFSRANFAVHAFLDEDLDMLQDYFTKLGLGTTRVKNKNGYNIQINSKSSVEFFEKIAPYVPTSMDYKLPQALRGLNKIEWWKDNKTILKVQEANLKELKFCEDLSDYKPQNLTNPKKTFRGGPYAEDAYDIEVEDTHCFFAEDLLVHNCIACYDPLLGFQLFSRVVSVRTFLNTDLTEKVLFINKGIIKTPEDLKGKFPYRFILDCEAMVDSENFVLDGVTYESVDDFLQAVLGSLPERAKDYQKAGCRLYFKVFDALYLQKEDLDSVEDFKLDLEERVLTNAECEWVEENFKPYLISSGFSTVDKIDKSRKKAKKLYTYLYSLKDTSKYDLRSRPFGQRRKIRKALVEKLQKANLPFIEITGEDIDKAGYTDELISSGEEGTVLKSLLAPYVSDLKSSRNHRCALKCKKNTTLLLENMDKMDDFDAFISGYNLPKSPRIKDMIGSLKLSIYLTDESGESYIHEVANIGGIPHELKREMTQVSESGEMSLKPEYLNKVLAIEGYGLSSKNLRFSMARFKDGKMEYKSKQPIDCTWEKEALESLISVRGK